MVPQPQANPRFRYRSKVLDLTARTHDRRAPNVATVGHDVPSYQSYQSTDRQHDPDRGLNLTVPNFAEREARAAAQKSP